MPQSAVQRFTERRLSLGNRRHDAIVKKFEEFLEKHPDRQLYLPEICSAIGSCERTLRTACEEHFGMGPILGNRSQWSESFSKRCVCVSLFTNKQEAPADERT